MTQKHKKTSPENQTRIITRRVKVYRMFLRGLTQETIAEAIGVERSTVARDLRFMRGEARKTLSKHRKSFDIEQFWSDCIAEIDEQKRDLWAYAAESKSDRSKISSELRETRKEKVQALQLAGVVVSKAAPEDLIQETFRIVVDNLPDRKKYNQKFKEELK